MKKILSTFLCFFIMFALTACGNKVQPILDENGDWIHYSEEEIVSDTYYILKDDGMYYQFLNVPVAEDSLGTLYSWFCEPYDAAIPHFTAKDKLMFYSTTKRPETLTLYKMTDYAYTLGVMFQVENDTGDLKHPQIIRFTDSFNSQSPVGGVVNTFVPAEADTYITGINNHEFTGNLLVDDSFLKGLTKDTMYQLEIYCGTVRKTVNIKADTHLFLKEATYTTASYEELKSKVFEIYLPQNLAPGYYYAEGVGMFYFDGSIDDIDEDDIENMLENQGENTESTEVSEEVAEGQEYGDTDPVYTSEETDNGNDTLSDLENEADGLEGSDNTEDNQTDEVGQAEPGGDTENADEPTETNDTAESDNIE